MAILTRKFSDFADGGDLANNETTVGLDGSVNTRFNNPWTFLKPGTTGDRPTPAASMYYRLRFNTTLEVYEYYDPTIPIWVELSGSGTGTVNPGVANDIAFYAASGQSVSPIAGAANSVLVTNGSEVPSLSTTLPSGLIIPGATITGSTAALLSGSVAAAPVAGTDLVNKTYADSLFGSGVQSLTGTTNQISFSSPTGNITASLPQDIALGSTPTFAGLTLSSIPLGSASGGTGINNGSSTLTLGGNLSTVGAFASAFTMTGATNVTFPTSGTLATTSQIPAITPAALTKTDDTNVTLTLGGTPSSALLQGVSLTLGWTGVLPASRGGTGTSTLGSGVSAALGTNIGSPGSFIVNGGALGTPSSGTLTNATGLPIGGISATGTPNSSTYLRGDGSWAAASGGGGKLVSVQVLVVGSGTTYTKPAGITSIMVEAVGGGGGGGGSTGGTSSASGAGGGGAGGYFKLWIPVAASSYTYSVGAGGSSGVAGNNVGGGGGTTTFSTASAAGGFGGSGCPAVASTGATFSAGGLGGAATGGTINVGGDCGSYGGSVSGNPLPGIGGSSVFGAGARGFNISAGGNGAGGGGAFSTSTSAAGGNGTNGVIFVWEYA